jgi:hypothetical protein
VRLRHWGYWVERQFAHRVICPTCGSFAQLRVAYRGEWPPVVVVFSCRNQTSAAHAPPTRDQLIGLIPTDVDLPMMNRFGYLS